MPHDGGSKREQPCKDSHSQLPSFTALRKHVYPSHPYKVSWGFKNQHSGSQNTNMCDVTVVKLKCNFYKGHTGISLSWSSVNHLSQTAVKTVLTGQHLPARPQQMWSHVSVLYSLFWSPPPPEGGFLHFNSQLVQCLAAVCGAWETKMRCA